MPAVLFEAGMIGARRAIVAKTVAEAVERFCAVRAPRRDFMRPRCLVRLPKGGVGRERPRQREGQIIRGREQQPSRCKIRPRGKCKSIRAWPLSPLNSADNSFSKATRSKSSLKYLIRSWGCSSPVISPVIVYVPRARAEHAIFGTIVDDALISVISFAILG